MHLKTITALLALSDFQVVKMLKQTESSIHLLVESIESVDPVCSAWHGSSYSKSPCWVDPSRGFGFKRQKSLPLCAEAKMAYGYKDGGCFSSKSINTAVCLARDFQLKYE